MNQTLRNKISKWPTWKVILIGHGYFLLAFIFLIFLKLEKIDLKTIEITFICWGVIAVIFGRYLGSALYEANKRQLSWLWRNLFRLNQKEIEKRFTGIPYGYTFTVIITYVVGILITSFSIYWLFVC